MVLATVKEVSQETLVAQGSIGLRQQFPFNGSWVLQKVSRV
jgi:hypothetical protein